MHSSSSDPIAGSVVAALTVAAGAVVVASVVLGLNASKPTVLELVVVDVDVDDELFPVAPSSGTQLTVSPTNTHDAH